MAQQNPKYRFNAKTWRFYKNGEYIKLPAALLKLLYYLSFTVEELPYIPGDEKIDDNSLFELRKRLGKVIGKDSAGELIECLTGLGHRFNPELLENNLLVVENPPTKKPSSELPFNYISLDEYAPFTRKKGGYQEEYE